MSARICRAVEGVSWYFATTWIVGIGEVPQRGEHYYAYVEDYLEFDRAVPFPVLLIATKS